jgi:serine phosphatase RsbU (regulator of sigma subunit)
MQRVTQLKRILLSICLLTTIFVFSRILTHQKNLNDANKSLLELKNSELILQLPEWTATFYFCYYEKGENTSNSCHEDSLRKEEKLTLPLKKFQNPTLTFLIDSTNQQKPANTVLLRTKLTPQQKESLLKKSKAWMLVLPRQLHRATFLGNNMGGETQYGMAIDAAFGVSETYLKNSDYIEIIINYKGLAEFGPLDIPVALVHPNSARNYTGLFEKQLGSAALSKQLLAGLPLVMGAVAAVLDHSPAMLLLALFGALRAVHTYFGFVSETSQLTLPELIINYSCLGLSLAFLLMFIEKLFDARFKKVTPIHRVIFAVLCAALAISGNFYVNDWQLSSTLWVDTIASAAGIILISFILIQRHMERAKNSKTQASAHHQNKPSENTFSLSMRVLQSVIAGAALLVHGSVNISELSANFTSTSVFTDPLDWRHMFLMPALLTAGLLEVGSIARRMQTFGQEMAQKALIEKELKVGHDVQARMLPARKFENDSWNWRAIYHPAEALAGDWFDIREITFGDNQRLLAICLADVTGHGVGSSLSTSVICSHWSLWCSNLGNRSFPTNAGERESLLAEAPLRVHLGLSALRKNENCTAMFVLIDPYANEVTICAAGHPGAIIMNENGLRYVTTQGERLGGELLGEAKWNPKTESFKKDDLLVVYSDGIVPVGQTVLGWAGRLKKQILAGEKRFELLLMNYLHENKRAFMVDPTNEDDMTLVMLKRK